MVNKPVLVYDGDCAFCTFWIQRWQKLAGYRIQFRPFQDMEVDYSEVSEQQFKSSIWFFSTRGNYYSAARALLMTVDHRHFGKTLLWLMNNIPGVNKLFDGIYYFMSHHRGFFWRLTKLMFRIV